MTATRSTLPVALALLLAFAGCQRHSGPSGSASEVRVPPSATEQPHPQNPSPQLKQLLTSAIEQTGITTGYDPAYVRLDYPAGDVPQKTGVCSDVLVRAFRKAGIDLQKEVHEDMRAAWASYPQRWGNARPDSNIDHRRVLNLMTFLGRQGKALPTTTTRDDYLPGDIVAWDLGGGVPHIGIVSNLATEPPKHFFDNSQHRRRYQSGRCFVQLEDHRPLPLLLDTFEVEKAGELVAVVL